VGTVPAPSGAGSKARFIASLSCTAVRCVGVGSYASRHHHVVQDVLVGAGTSYVATNAPRAPRPAGFRPGPLVEISCQSNGSCVALGTGHEGDGGYLLTGAPGNWHDSAMALPKGAEGLVDSAATAFACPPSGPCALVGDFGRRSAGGLPEGFADVQG
jgi:hypothetical protein